MKKITFIFLVVCFLGSCKKIHTDNVPVIPDWLKHRIAQDEQVLKSNPHSSLNISAWISYKYNNDLYFEFVDLLSSAFPKTYDYDGNEINYSEDSYLDYQSKKCCKYYIWKGPSYFDIAE